MPMSPTDQDAYTALIAFIRMIVPTGTPVIQGQQNRVAEPNVPCVILTTLGAPRRIGTNAESITVGPEWSADGAPLVITADGGPDNFTADGTIADFTFTAEVEADFEYSVQADFYSPDAESWSMSTELLWRSKLLYSVMPDGLKPLYSEGRQQLPLIGGEEQWIARWTMTLVLDYQPVWTQVTQAATTAEIIPEAIDVFFPP